VSARVVQEVPGQPHLVLQVVLHGGDVRLGGIVVPAPGEPQPHTAPDVAGPVTAAEPGLVALEAVAPGGEGGIHVVGGGALGVAVTVVERPSPERLAHLEDPEGLAVVA